MPASTLRVLVVARWYPSHDARTRGAFVADLVEAVRGHGGVEQRIASWEPALVRPTAGPADRASSLEQAELAWRERVAEPSLLTIPHGWGAKAIPVARLRVLDDAARRSPAESVTRHAALLVPFATHMHRSWPIDVVHAHTGMPDGLAARRVAEALGLPLIVTEHASDAASVLTDDEWARAEYQALARRPGTRLLAVSRAQAEHLLAAGGFDRSQLTVMPNAVPVERFEVVPPGARDPNELLWVGARREHKGADVLLRAFAQVHREREGLRLRLIGSAPVAADDRRWRDLATELGVAAAVTFEPAAGREQVAAAMARAAIFVHPSPRETFGMVAAEALASGLPVAATPSGGVEEIVGTGGEFGQIASSTEPAALATAIRDLLDRRATLDPRAMRAHVESQFGAPSIARRMVDLYQELASGSPALPPPAGSGAARGLASVPSATSARSEHGADPSQPAAARPFVVALWRALLVRRLQALEGLPFVRSTFVTSVGPAGAEQLVLPPGARLVEIDPEAGYRAAMRSLAGPDLRWAPDLVRRLVRAAIRPRAYLHRRRLVGQRERLRQEAAATAVLAAWEEHVALDPDAGPHPGWLVACDAEDVEAAAGAIAAGARLAPGGLRWLADAATEMLGPDA